MQPEDIRGTLRNQIARVLDRYLRNNTSDGINANLNLWFKNKWPLVETLSKHPQWDRNALAVKMEINENRPIDERLVHRNKEKLIEMARFRQTLAEYSYLNYRTAMNIICDNPTKLCNAKKIEEINAITPCGNFAANTKSSRVITKISDLYAIEDIDNEKYKSHLAMLNDAINPISRKVCAFLSVHPCDYLEMSNRDNSWSSCHCLGSKTDSDIEYYEPGGYCGGTLSYMNDAVTMIFYTTNSGVSPPFYAAPKIHRQIFCYGDGRLLQNRLYPIFDNDDYNGIRTTYLNLVKGIITSCLGLPDSWKTQFTGMERVIDDNVENHEHSLFFSDHHEPNKRPTLSTLSCVEKPKNRMLIGERALCVNCGHLITESSSLYCDVCGEYEREHANCVECGRRLHLDDLHNCDGEYYCDNCSFYCEHCDNYVGGNDSHHVDDETWCNYCYEDDASTCACCGNAFHVRDLTDVSNGDVVCDSCLERLYATCDYCGNYAMIGREAYRALDGTTYCHACLESEGSLPLAPCKGCRTLYDKETLSEDGLCEKCQEEKIAADKKAGALPFV